MVDYGLSMALVRPSRRRVTLLELLVRLEARGLGHREILTLVPRLVNSGLVVLTGCCCGAPFQRRD